MRAIVITQQDAQTRQKVLVSDWPAPAAPVGNQVKIRTLYTGITNGTERNQLLKGNYAPPDERLPAPSGYQTVGRVTQTGPDAACFQPGDHVYAGGGPSGHLEYVVAAGDDLVVKLPASVDLQQAALFGMASVALNTCRNADLKLGQSVLAVGAGCVGQIAAQIAALFGARVTICDIDDRRLDVAQRIGAVEEALNVSGAGWTQQIADASFDAALDFAGVPGMEDQLLQAVCRGGQVLFIAGRDKVGYNFNLGQRRLITIKQNSHFYNDDLDNLCRLVSRGLINLAPLLKDVVAVEEAKRIYDTLRDQPNELLGTVFNWQ